MAVHPRDTARAADGAQAVNGNGNGRRIVATRLSEGTIIAVVTAGLSVWGAQAVIQRDIEYLTSSVDRMERTVDRNVALLTQVEAMRDALTIHTELPAHAAMQEIAASLRESQAKIESELSALRRDVDRLGRGRLP